MTLEIGYVLALLVGALVLFAWDVVGIDVVGIFVILALAVPGVLTPGEALAGFGSDTVVVIAALFVVTEGIVRTGVVERLGLRLSAAGRGNPTRLVRVILVVVTSVIAVLVVLGLLIKLLDLKRKRDSEAIVVQARISDAILRDPRLFSLAITPTASFSSAVMNLEASHLKM